MMKKLLKLLFWEYHLSVYFKLFSAKRERQILMSKIFDVVYLSSVILG